MKNPAFEMIPKVSLKLLLLIVPIVTCFEVSQNEGKENLKTAEKGKTILRVNF